MKVYCHVCHYGFHAQRSSAKYCSEGCKQTAKRARALNDPERAIDDLAIQAKRGLEQLNLLVQNDKIDQSIKPELLPVLDELRVILDKMDMKVTAIDVQYNDAWFQCKNCGQRTFGRVKKCDFCKGTKFERIAMFK